MNLWFKMTLMIIPLNTFYLLMNKNTLLTMSILKMKEETEISIIIDEMSILFSMVVLVISLSIAVFSLSYMSHENNKKRFTILMVLFVLSMQTLIFSSNFILIMLGWDGLGLTSYCLVIYFQNFSSLQSGLITMLTNRLGDCFMILAISLMMSKFITKMEKNSMKIMLMLILFAAFTKSAQAPFSAWLPEAMAAPTPVSSLVHSSTLVTAGVYLLTRFNIVLMNKINSYITMMASMTTSMLAGLTAWKETDGKKIVAMSTLSQLGLMMFSLSMKAWKVCLFHMSTHAMFKALLFINTGYNMNNNIGAQEKRLTIFSNSMFKPMMISANLSLIGMPFMAGFYSKDIILEFNSNKEMNLLIFFLFKMSCILTMIYTMVLLKSINNQKKKIILTKQEKKDKLTLTSTFILFIFMMLIGPCIMNMFFLQTPKTMNITKKMGLLFIIAGLILYSFMLKKNNFFTKINMMMLSKLSKDKMSFFNISLINQSKTDNSMNIFFNPEEINKNITMMNTMNVNNTKKNLINIMMIMLIIFIMMI